MTAPDVQKPIDETEDFIHIRVKDPGQFKTCRTTDFSGKLPKGVRAKYCQYKDKDEWAVQAWIFTKADGWTVEKAKAWVKDHSDEFKIAKVVSLVGKTIVMPGILQKSEEDDTIEGWATTGAIDLDNQIIEPTAFEEDLPAFMKNPIMRFMHEYPVGKWLDAKAEVKGLYVKGKFASTERAKEVKQLVDEGIVKGLSIAAKIKEDGTEWRHDDELDQDILHFTKLRLLEISVVDVPANPEAMLELSKRLKLDSEPILIGQAAPPPPPEVPEGVPKEKSPPLSEIEIKDIEVAQKELAEGKGRTFNSAEDAIKWLNTEEPEEKPKEKPEPEEPAVPPAAPMPVDLGAATNTVPTTIIVGLSDVSMKLIPKITARVTTEADGKVTSSVQELVMPEVDKDVPPTILGSIQEFRDAVQNAPIEVHNEDGSITVIPPEGESNEKVKFSRGAVESHEPPKAEEGKAWDANAAIARLKVWAEAFGDEYKTGFAWSDPENSGSCKLPHHDIVDGGLVVVWNGVAAAMEELLRARGEVDIPAADRKGVYSHLARHYRQFDKEVPEFKSVKQLLIEEMTALDVVIADKDKIIAERDATVKELVAKLSELETKAKELTDKLSGPKVTEPTERLKKSGVTVPASESETDDSGQEPGSVAELFPARAN